MNTSFFLTARTALNLGQFFFIILVFGIIQPAFGKNLVNRLGVGFSNQFSVDGDLPSLAVRYLPAADLIVGASIGVDTEKGSSRFGFSGRLMRVIFQEDNMNFYLGASAGVISQEKNSDNDSGFDLSGFGGGEFFFSGLDSLGFNFEMGVGITSISSEVRFRTIGDHPFRAGIIFYF